MGMVTSRGPEFEEGVDYNTMDSMVGMASVGFKVADASLQPPQAIAILSAGDQVTDEFGTGNDKFTKVDNLDLTDNLYAYINGEFYNLKINKRLNSDTGAYDLEANFLIYKNNAGEYILQVDGTLVYIKNIGNIFDGSNLNMQNGGNIVYDSQTNLDEFIAFAEKMGITEHTVLGAKIVLKLLMANMNYDMRKLDESFMDPQADYLAFINQTLSPIIEAGLTATMSGLKSAIEFLKKIVQKASS